MTTTTATDRRIPALCAIRGHDIGPDVCRVEKCDSATLVGLHAAARLAREAWEQLTCGCPSPGECCCPVEAHRLRFAHARRWAEDEVRARAGVWWRLAEQILDGGLDPNHCAMHPFSAAPCVDLCREDDG